MAELKRSKYLHPKIKGLIRSCVCYTSRVMLRKMTRGELQLFRNVEKNCREYNNSFYNSLHTTFINYQNIPGEFEK